jgi:hypothetical protein
MATKAQTFRKDPKAKLQYGFDWSSWLDSGDTISTSVWTVPTGITEVSNANDDDSTTITLSGGTAGETYTVANKITTADGYIDERSFDVVVENR